MIHTIVILYQTHVEDLKLNSINNFLPRIIRGFSLFYAYEYKVFIVQFMVPRAHNKCSGVVECCVLARVINNKYSDSEHDTRVLLFLLGNN